MNKTDLMITRFPRGKIELVPLEFNPLISELSGIDEGYSVRVVYDRNSIIEKYFAKYQEALDLYYKYINKFEELQSVTTIQNCNALKELK